MTLTAEERRINHNASAREWNARNMKRKNAEINANPELIEKRRLYNNARAKKLYHANKEKGCEAGRKWRQANPEKFAESWRASKQKAREENPRREILWHLKQNARKKGLPFDLIESDLVWPTHCPVFGMELVYIAQGYRSEASASADRHDNNSGYVKGNVRIISWKANRLKNNATIEDLLKVVKYMQGAQP
jgi:hypothetical protein